MRLAHVDAMMGIKKKEPLIPSSVMYVVYFVVETLHFAATKSGRLFYYSVLLFTCTVVVWRFFFVFLCVFEQHTSRMQCVFRVMALRGVV